MAQQRQVVGLVLPNPMPGSTQTSRTPAGSARPARSSRNERTSSATAPYCGFSCMVRGCPRMCMATQPAPAAAATSHSEAEMSFTRLAPAANAAVATSGLTVSTDTRTAPPLRRARRPAPR